MIYLISFTQASVISYINKQIISKFLKKSATQIMGANAAGPGLFHLHPKLREDTHKKGVFFSGRTTKGVGRVKPPDH